MPIDEQSEMYRDMMEKMMKMPKETLKAIMLEPGCPAFLSELIRTHPALLGYKKNEKNVDVEVYVGRDGMSHLLVNGKRQ